MATAKKISVHVSTTLGSVSALIRESVNPKAVMTLAHGAGAGMTHSFMESMAEELAANAITTIRFNFPFTENAKKRPDPPAIAEKTVDAILHKAHELYPALPLVAAGKSFGGRMTSQRLARDCPSFVKGITFFGFPLHAAGAPSVERAKHLSSITIPMLFLQGTKDTLAQIKLVEKIKKKLSTASLVKFDGADHSFKVSKKVLTGELARAVSQWIDFELK